MLIMNNDTKAYNDKFEPEDKKICDALAGVVDEVFRGCEQDMARSSGLVFGWESAKISTKPS